MAGGGVWTPVALVRTRLALHRGQLFAETGISLPQRLQTIDRDAFSVTGSPDDSMRAGVTRSANCDFCLESPSRRAAGHGRGLRRFHSVFSCDHVATLPGDRP